MDKIQEVKLQVLKAKTSLLWLFPDICETLLMELEEELRTVLGKKLKFAARMNYNKAIKSLRGLKKELEGFQASTQASYGEDADKVLAILMALTDRCADDEDRMRRVYEFITAFPSKMSIPMSRYEAEFSPGGERSEK